MNLIRVDDLFIFKDLKDSKRKESFYDILLFTKTNTKNLNHLNVMEIFHIKVFIIITKYYEEFSENGKMGKG